MALKRGRNSTRRPSREENTRKFVDDLHKGTLLVRLSTGGGLTGGTLFSDLTSRKKPTQKYPSFFRRSRTKSSRTSFCQASEPAPRVVFCTMSNASPSRCSAGASFTCGSNSAEPGPASMSSAVNIGVSCCAAQSARRCNRCCGDVLELEFPILP